MKKNILQLVTVGILASVLPGCGKHDHEKEGHSHTEQCQHADGVAGTNSEAGWQPNMVEECQEHDHAGLPYEWLGLFDLQEGEYTWTFSKVDGKYAKSYISMAVLNAEDSSGIEENKAQAERLLESTDKAKLQDGAVLLAGSAYELYFDQQKEVTLFKISIKTPGHYLFYTELMPMEFEAGEHFFKDAAGKDIKPLKEESAEGPAHVEGGHAH